MHRGVPVNHENICPHHQVRGYKVVQVSLSVEGGQLTIARVQALKRTVQRKKPIIQENITEVPKAPQLVLGKL